MRRFTVVAALSLAALSQASPARADAESDAKDLFARGRDLRAQNDCAGAAPLFRKAWTIFPQGLGSLRNLAECEEAVGHFASARRAWLDLKRALITMPPSPKYEGWDKDAETAAANLAPKVATLVVDVVVRSPQGEAPANDKSGVELFVNGESVGPLVSTPLERDPGTYRVRAQTEDAEPVEHDVTLQAGDKKHVLLRLTKHPKPVVVSPELPGPAGAESHGGRRTLGWILTGVGGAAIAGGVVTFLLRGSAKSDLDSACGGDPSRCVTNDRDNVDSIQSRGQTMSTLTTILLPVGVVAAGAGVALVLTSGSSSSSTRGAAPARRVVLAPTGTGLQLAGTF